MNQRDMYSKEVKGIFSLYGLGLSRKVMSYVQRSCKKHTDFLWIATLSPLELDYFAKKPYNYINNIPLL